MTVHHGNMTAREALEIAVMTLTDDNKGQIEAREVLQMMLDQESCGEIPMGNQKLTDAIDVAMFG